MPDLLLTTIASALLLGYAGWNLYAEITTTGAPSPISMGAATAGLMGVLGGGWMALTVWLATRRDAAASPAVTNGAEGGDGGDAPAIDAGQPTPTPQPDGGVESPAEER
jgi:signal peptidase